MPQFPVTVSASPHPPTRTHPLWLMLLALLSGFALSQSYRTVTAIVAASSIGIIARSLYNEHADDAN